MDLMNLLEEKVDVRPAHFYRTGLSESGVGWGALYVQMDFTRTFQTNTKCNNINHV